jgi:transmembrane sensor
MKRERTMQNKNIEELLKRYAQGQCSEEEKAFIESAYINYLPEVDTLTEEEIEEDLATIKANLPKGSTVARIRVLWVAAALGLLIVLYLIIFFFL